jgi:hypothetical protein
MVAGRARKQQPSPTSSSWRGLCSGCCDVSSKQSTEAAQLMCVIEVSERIKQLSSDAAQLRVQAMNARIQTRSEGRAVPGFEMVASHMIDLSQDLDASAQRLRGLTVEWVRAASALLGCERERALFAEVCTTRTDGALSVARTHNGSRRRLLVERIERCRRAFVAELEGTGRMSHMGCVLASSAKIEATYGGGLALRLSATAGTFDAVACGVRDAVATLMRNTMTKGHTA